MTDRRTIAVLTTGRQDYGILRSTIKALDASETLRALIYVGGMHLSPRFGRTITHLEADGVRVARELDFLSDPPDTVADTSRAVAAVGAALAADRPDALLLVGDRTETLAAGVAAAISGIPIIHLHGGEETEGAIDNVSRHALTKLSHLHLVTHAVHAARVEQMGEDPSTVIVVGPPGIDNYYRTDLPTRTDVERTVGIPLRNPVVVVTVHPTTLSATTWDVRAVAAALERIDATYVITAPNSDSGGEAIRSFWSEWVSERDNAVLVDALGEDGYWSLLRLAAAVIGNSSSGIIEAPTTGVPVINVGDRQLGRLKFGDVTDVPADTDTIAAALRNALIVGRRVPTTNAYPSGPAAPRIAAAIERWSIPVPPRKSFFTLSSTTPASPRPDERS